jgi:hypothetical protein
MLARDEQGCREVLRLLQRVASPAQVVSLCLHAVADLAPGENRFDWTVEYLLRPDDEWHRAMVQLVTAWVAKHLVERGFAPGRDFSVTAQGRLAATAPVRFGIERFFAADSALEPVPTHPPTLSGNRTMETATEQEIYTKFQSHFDDDGNFHPDEFGLGEDVHRLEVPAGKQFARYELEIHTDTMGSTASVTQAPGVGAAGRQVLKVKWMYGSFGKLAYTVRAFASNDPPAGQPVTVWVPKSQWERSTLDLVRQGRPARLVLQGPDALVLVNALRLEQGEPPLPRFQASHAAPVPQGAWTDAVAALSAAAKLIPLAVSAVACAAGQYGYRGEIRFDRKGPLPFDDHLEVLLLPTSEA